MFDFTPSPGALKTLSTDACIHQYTTSRKCKRFIPARKSYFMNKHHNNTEMMYITLTAEENSNISLPDLNMLTCSQQQ